MKNHAQITLKVLSPIILFIVLFIFSIVLAVYDLFDSFQIFSKESAIVALFIFIFNTLFFTNKQLTRSKKELRENPLRAVLRVQFYLYRGTFWLSLFILLFYSFLLLFSFSSAEIYGFSALIVSVGFFLNLLLAEFISYHNIKD